MLWANLQTTIIPTAQASPARPPPHLTPSRHVNYEDPNLNVGLPILIIHGHNDDPSGQDSLSAVDILCNLVNYFGKLPLGGSTIGHVQLSPVMIQKVRGGRFWGIG